VVRSVAADAARPVLVDRRVRSPFADSQSWVRSGSVEIVALRLGELMRGAIFAVEKPLIPCEPSST